MRTYEISNPTDFYTIRGEPLDCAVVTFLLGTGNYGLEAVDDDGEDVATRLPMFAFAGDPEEALNEWMAKELGCPLNEFVQGRWAQLAEVFEAIIIGDREEYDRGLAACADDGARAAFADGWHDNHRSSLNDIGGRARAYAKQFREKASSGGCSSC